MARAAEKKRSRVGRDEDTGELIAALDLVPLLAPYKKHGRLSLRVERLPQTARLSRGTRNNDGSWSLTRDDLDDLTYSGPASGAPEAINVRIINLAGGNTLAVVEAPLKTDADEDNEPEAKVEAVAAAPASGGDAQARRLKDELAAVKIILASREAELAELRAEGAGSGGPSEDLQSALAQVRAEAEKRVAQADALIKAAQEKADRELKAAEAKWRAEAATANNPAQAEEIEQLHAALAGAEAEAEETRKRLKAEAKEALEKAEAAWKAAEAKRLAEAEAGWREQSEKAIADAGARNDDKATAELSAMRKKLAESQDVLAKAQASWKTAEAKRMAEAEAAWREETEKAVEGARLEAGARKDDKMAGELSATRKKLAEATAKLAENEAALEDAREGLEQARADAAREVKDAVTKAERAWKAGEAARLAAAEAEWREQSEEALAEERAKAGVRKDDGSAAELAALRKKYAEAQTKLAESEAALVEALSKTAAPKNDAELASLKKKLVETQAKLVESDAALVEAQSKAAARKDDKSDAEVASLKKKLADAQAKLGESESALEEAREALDRTKHEGGASGDSQALRERVEALKAKLIEKERALAAAEKLVEGSRREANDLIAKAEKEFRAREAQRRDAAEAEWRKDSADELAQAKARYEAAESALAQVRIKSGGVGRSDQEFAAMRAQLEARTEELEHARKTIAQLQDDGAGEQLPMHKRYMKEILMAACVGAVAVGILPFVFSSSSPPAKAPEVQVAAIAPVVEAAPLAKATLTKDTKLRSEPLSSAGGSFVAAKGEEVLVVQALAEWTLVRTQGAKPMEGWVRNAVVQETPPPAPAKKSRR